MKTPDRKTAIRRFASTAAFSAAVLLGAQSASATPWSIDDVLGGIGNFGASLFHSASGSNPMSGSTLLNFTSWDVSGQYDDISGFFKATFSNPGDSDQYFTFESVALPGGSFKFGADGGLASTASFSVDFSDEIVNTTDLIDDILTFKSGYVCCGTTPGDAPNSFSPTSGIFALWGATQYNAATGHYDYDSRRFGLDIRLKLTPVPLPAALPLFAGALGLMGFMGWRRKRIAA